MLIKIEIDTSVDGWRAELAKTFGLATAEGLLKVTQHTDRAVQFYPTVEDQQKLAELAGAQVALSSDHPYPNDIIAADNAAVIAQQQQAEPEEAPKRRGRRPRAETASETPAAQESPSPEEPDLFDAPDPEPGPDWSDISTVLNTLKGWFEESPLGAADAKTKTFDVLRSGGFSDSDKPNISSIPVGKRAKFMEEVHDRLFPGSD